ncbi:MAG: hypothetical protein IT200_18000 [Thermoleophilia bacterium]|nr:hypothetical protein [Thermoleophilia bacterium]
MPPGSPSWSHGAFGGLCAGNHAWRLLWPGERLPVRLEALPYAETIHLTLGTLLHETPRVPSTAITELDVMPGAQEVLADLAGE